MIRGRVSYFDKPPKPLGPKCKISTAVSLILELFKYTRKTLMGSRLMLSWGVQRELGGMRTCVFSRARKIKGLGVQAWAKGRN